MHKHIIQTVFLAFLISGCGSDALSDDAVRVATNGSSVTLSNTEAYFIWRAKKGPSGSSMRIVL